MICSPKQGKRKHEVQGEERGDGNFWAIEEGQSQDKSCGADLDNERSIELEG